MRTPIFDFVDRYAQSEDLRLHMPGHKGVGALGVERLDITEIEGADVLYGGSGIIRESEENAATMFGAARTLYSTEGSSLSIRGMLYLALLWGKREGRAPVIAAGRNAHRAFMTAAGLLDFEIAWLYPEGEESLLSCTVTPTALERFLASRKPLPAAVFVTSPDYLGNLADVRGLAAVCHRYGVPLLVDNAHGAYLNFLPESRHPIALGADLCCDSAHKTLPVLTGGGYLHLSRRVPPEIAQQAERAMSLFASTSPSYLILQSLDLANRYLAEGYRQRLCAFAESVRALKEALAVYGYSLTGDEPLKLTVCPKSFGYTGDALAERLADEGIVCEFSDRDYCVMMLTPEVGEAGLSRLERALLSLKKRPPIEGAPPAFFTPRVRLSLREALLMPRKSLPAAACLGRTLASATVSCPPAVPILVAGEVVTPEALSLFAYYGIEALSVTDEGEIT